MENSPASPSPSPGMLESQINSHIPSPPKKKNDAFHFLLRNLNPVWKEWDKYDVDYVFDKKTFPDGFPRFAALLSSDPAFQIFCRFRWLHTQCLLDVQKELLGYERQLRDFVRKHNSATDVKYQLDAENNPTLDSSKLLDSDPRKLRIDLMSNIKKKLLEYGQLTDQQSKLLNYVKPDELSYTSLKYTLFAAEKYEDSGDDSSDKGSMRVDPSHYEWLFRVDDLMTLSTVEKKMPLQGLVEMVLISMPTQIFKLLRLTTKVDSLKYRDDGLAISDSREKAVVNSIRIIGGLVLLFVPIGQLYFHVDDWTRWDKYGAIIGWSFGFALFWLLTTTPKLQGELGSAVSGYTAILLIFLGLSHT